MEAPRKEPGREGDTCNKMVCAFLINSAIYTALRGTERERERDKGGKRDSKAVAEREVA